MGDFYGMNIFLAESSATSSGIDSLLEPIGPINRAQEKAARAFGSKQTFFATNGTSTCNKIVVQAIARPGDIVLVEQAFHEACMTHTSTSPNYQTIASLDVGRRQVEVLVRIATELDERLEDASAMKRKIHQRRVKSLREDLPPLPDSSAFHNALRPDPEGATPEG
ncbi:hypothetical protein ACKVEX_03360, partial [Rhodocyclaceae bacterium SMB388]